MNKKSKLFILAVIAILVTYISTASSYASFSSAVNIPFNPNKIKFDEGSGKNFIAESMTNLNHDKAKKYGSDKLTFSEDDISLEQIYKMFIFDINKVTTDSSGDFDSYIQDIDRYFGVYMTKSQASGSCVVYANNQKENIVASITEGKQALRISSFYNKVLKNKKISDIKLIIHPSHDSNKLFYITENTKKYVIPVLVEGKDNEIGLKSFHEYTPDEILKNIREYIEKFK